MTQGWKETGAAWLVPALMALALPVAGAAQTPPEPSPTHPSDVPASATERALESRTKGNPEAEVVVFEIADFQCPYCARFSERVAPALNERYVDTGLVQWVFVNLPLHTHPLAWHAAEAALCAGVAGDRFWAMHDALFASQDEWSGSPDARAHIDGLAAELGVQMEEYERCTREDQIASLILQDFASAVSAGIDGTPTFIIMKDDQVVQRVVGVKTVEEWAEVLDAALAR